MGSRSRTEPFNASEWHAFRRWLNYVEHGLRTAADQAMNSSDDPGELGVSVAVTGMRWYATELANFESLLYRAAGLRDDEKVCYDAEIEGLYARLRQMFPQLRQLRNALFSHPPFVDELLDDETVLFFTNVGIFKAPAEGGSVEAVVSDPLLTLPDVLELIAEFRSILDARFEGS